MASQRCWLSSTISVIMIERVKGISETPPKTKCDCLHGGVIEHVAHGILSPQAVYLHLYMYRCGCTYRVILRVFS